MSGVLALVSSMALYARQVIMLAEGALVVRTKKPSARLVNQAASPAKDDGAPRKQSDAIRGVDPPQTLRGPVSSRTDLPAAAGAPNPPSAKVLAPSAGPTSRPQTVPAVAKQASPSPGEAGHRKLTKAERKALKRQRLAAAEQDDWWERGQ
jgi:hypothetical protein